MSGQDQRAAELVGAREQAATALAEAAPVAERAATDRTALELAQQGLEAASEAAELTTELTETRARLSEATGHAQELRQAYLDLRERRITGMAAELAGALAVGCSCPVCGSVDHPAPAAASGAISRADEDAARERYENADFESQNVRELVATLSTRLQGALVRCGGHTVNHWRRSAAAAATAAAASTAAEREATRLRDELAEIEVEEKPLATELAASRVSLEERTRERDEAAERVDHLRAELRHPARRPPRHHLRRRARRAAPPVGARARRGARRARVARTGGPRAHPGRGSRRGSGDRGRVRLARAGGRGSAHR